VRLVQAVPKKNARRGLALFFFGSEAPHHTTRATDGTDRSAIRY